MIILGSLHGKRVVDFLLVGTSVNSPELIFDLVNAKSGTNHQPYH